MDDAEDVEILIEDPRDDCSGFDGIDLIPGALDHNWQEIALVRKLQVISIPLKY